MRKLLRAAAVVIGVTVVLGACAKSTGPKITCGTGTHDDGAGTCQLDNALALDNIVGSNYWACPNHGSLSAYFFYFSVSSNGSGTLWLPVSPAPPHYAITWQEGAAQDEMTVSANPFFDTLQQIVPSSPVGAQSFTAKAYKSGVLVYDLSCQLKLGTF